MRRALISVADKTGVADFAAGLAKLGVEIVSTGGTLSVLKEAGVEARPVEELTGLPGDPRRAGEDAAPAPARRAARRARQPRARRRRCGSARSSRSTWSASTSTRSSAPSPAATSPEEEAIENIDIGGPTMIRAAAKNHRFVAVVVKPESYDAVLGELEETGELSAPTRHWLANEAFAYTARYDAAISRWFGRRYEQLPEHWVTSWEKELDLTYGENPHQRAALYVESRVALARALAGREAARQAALVQQRARPRLGAEAAARDLEGAGLRDRQAQQPLRGGRGRDDRGRLRGGLRLRPDLGLRRRDRAQPARRREARRAAERAVRRGPDRARLRGRRARGAAAEGGDPDPRGHRAARPPDRARHQAGAGRDPGPGPRRLAGAAGADGGGDQDPADRGAVGGPAVRLARGAPRPLERDRARPRTGPRSASAPAR